jgi:predicted MFS family arabinose efflux permease
VATVWIGLPAFFMGFPFPVALGQLERRHQIPWALALNGLGSVLGSLGATLVAVHFGLRTLALTGIGLYALAALLMLEPNRASPAQDRTA